RVGVAVRVEQGCDSRHLVADPAAELGERHGRSAVRQLESRLAAGARDGEIARVDLALLRGVDGWARREQTVEQQRLHEAQLRLIEADRVGRRQVERTHLDVLYALLAQGHDGPRAARLRGLRTDRAVVFVLDLQDVRVQLTVLPADLDADGGVAVVDGRHGGREARDVFVERIRADAQRTLRRVAIADIAHTQR